MQIQNSHPRPDADSHGPSIALKRLLEEIAAHLRPKPDHSLANEKFSDSFERELAERVQRRYR